MMKSEDLSVVRRHKTTSFLQHHGVKGATDDVSIKAAVNQQTTLKNNSISGLCSNCEQLPNCHWKENHKIFCEHYY